LSNFLVDMCTLGSANRTGLFSFLRELEKQQFTWELQDEPSITESIESHLIKCNLLYFDPDQQSLRVQNKLLETGVTTPLNGI